MTVIHRNRILTVTLNFKASEYGRKAWPLTLKMICFVVGLRMNKQRTWYFFTILRHLLLIFRWLVSHRLWMKNRSLYRFRTKLNDLKKKFCHQFVSTTTLLSLMTLLLILNLSRGCITWSQQQTWEVFKYSNGIVKQVKSNLCTVLKVIPKQYQVWYLLTQMITT